MSDAIASLRRVTLYPMVLLIFVMMVVLMFRTNDRFTGTQAKAAIESRDAERALLWNVACREHPESPECEGRQ